MQAAIESARKLAALQPDTIFFGHGTPKQGDAATALQELVEGL
jgi:glyoxylase-like metal-dependent hydrolase (beta-lactamase superfamily II)